MRLLDAILDANRRRLAGDAAATVPNDVANALPIAALSCIDVRLNHLLPEMLGVREEHFIWLRNAGNIVTGPMSSTMRSLALACAVKGAREIAIIGHTDCQVCKTTMLQLLEKLGALGVDRHRLPENLVEYFGLFSSERQNVLHCVDVVRSSPLIGGKVPVHGLLIEVPSGRIECVVNGYDSLGAVTVPGKAGELFGKAEQTLDRLARIGNAAAEEFKVPTAKIGEVVSVAQEWLHKAEQVAAAAAGAKTSAAPSKSPAPATAPAPTAEPPAMTPAQPNAFNVLQDRMRQFRNAKTTPRPPRKH